MNLGIPRIVLASAGAVFAVSVAFGQTAEPATSAPATRATAFANPPHKNLKVLPQDISGAELLGTMTFFAESLGVRCAFCHVGKEGQPLSTFDFASDAKPEKRTAREMMAMVDRIDTDDFDITEAKVTCYTCHRASTAPLSKPPAAAPVGQPPHKLQ
jgi:hypothetical protein